MSNQKNYKKFIAYVIILFFSITGFVYAVAANNQEQIKATGGTNDTNTKGEKDGVVVSKTISPTDTENFFDITLTVDTEHKIEEVMRDQDLAIVIVMDVSNTMIQFNVDGTENNYGKEKTDANGKGTGKYYADYVAGKSGDKTRYGTAITAGVNFVDEFAKYSSGTGDDTVRKIGFVAFNSDAKKISGLKTVKSTEAATSFKNTMKSKTEEIVEVNRYRSQSNRFTNIEAGIKMAHDMLNDAGNVDNKIIIFLSDGLPTTYIESGYKGYDTYVTGTTSKEGVFHNEILNKKCLYGTSYSNRAAIRARKEAAATKADGITIYSVGTGIEKQTTVPEYMEIDKGRSYSVIDTDKVDSFETGKSTDDFKSWLKNKIGSKEYYNASDKASLEKAYTEIFKKIKDSIEVSSQATWVAEDPMGTDGTVKNIEFIGLYDDKGVLKESLVNKQTDETDTASFSNNRITWDLKNSQYTETKEGSKTTYHYELKYRVRLENELSTFQEGTIYSTNGYTKLTYVTRTDGILSENKEIAFPEPSVTGYLGELSFTKTSSYDGRTLEGAEFELVHDETNCSCHDAYLNMKTKKVNITPIKATSNENGLVTFTNVPSGHSYILKETKAPDNHNLPSEETNKIPVVVAYGNTTSTIANTNFVNPIKTGSITLNKIVEGNDSYTGAFKFKVEVYFEGKNIKNEVVSLKNGESTTISNLPVGSTYKITETTTNGYKVQYNVNKTGEILGDTTTCGSSNCSVKEGAANTVTFTNIAGYILPATGSSGMLILAIIGSLLLIGPVIYIIYTFLKKRSIS